MNDCFTLADAFPVCPLADAGIRPVDSLQHFPNSPGTGWASTRWIIAKTDGTTEAMTKHPRGVSSPMFDLSAFSSGNDFIPAPRYSSVANDPDRVGGKNIPINDQTLDAIRATFAAGRQQGCPQIPRFSYACDIYAGCEPDDIEWILYHIRQLAAVVNEFANCIPALECGMFGPWGEMHSSKYTSPGFSSRILGAWLEHLDPAIPLLCRMPIYIVHFLRSREGDPELPFADGETPGSYLLSRLPLANDDPARRLSLFDDGYMGTDTNWGTYNHTLTRSAGVAFLRQLNQTMPYGGEFAHTHPDYLREHGSPIYENWFIQELYDTGLSYLRNLKKAVWPEVEPLRPFGQESYGIQKELVRMPFDARFAFDGMPDVSCYYGQSMHKFLIDHIGYRLILRDAKITPEVKKGGSVVFTGKVENTGFGNVPGKFLCEILLETPRGETVVVKGDVDPGTFKTRTVTDYCTGICIPRDASAGTYKVFLRFATVPYGSGAPYAIPFANPGVYCEKRTANYIGSFTIREET